jgi:uncharacterized protein (TIGR03545 family)
MSRALRWQFLVPRLLLLVVLLLAAQYSLGRIARRTATGWLEAVAHKQVDVAHARVSLFRRELALSDLQVRPGRKSAPPLLEVDRCELKLAVGPLLYRKTTVERGRLSGVRLNVPPKSPVARDAAADIKWVDGQACDRAREWLERLDQCFDQELPRQCASLERTNAMCALWPEYAGHFDARIRELKLRSETLQKSWETAQVNPLRHAAFLQSLPDQVAALRAEFARAHADLERLATAFESKRRDIVATRQQDEQRLRAGVNLDPIDSNVLSMYFLRESLSGQVTQAIGLLRWAREIVPARSTSSPTAARGQDVAFTGCPATPSLVVRNLQIFGTARLAGRNVELGGTLTDVTDAPALHSSPIRLRAKATGSLPIELQATIDRTGPEARDELLVDCRGLVMPALNLGQSNGDFRLSLAPSVATLSISVLVEGEKLSGDIQLVQRQVKITPVFTGQLSDVPLAAALGTTLAELDSLAVQVKLGGTLSEPTCSLWSTLGPAVAEATKRAMRRAGDEHAQALMERARRQVDERLAKLEQQIQAQRNDLAAQKTAATGELERVATQQTPAARLSHERFGTRLPTGSLFR